MAFVHQVATNIGTLAAFKTVRYPAPPPPHGQPGCRVSIICCIKAINRLLPVGTKVAMRYRGAAKRRVGADNMRLRQCFHVAAQRKLPRRMAPPWSRLPQYRAAGVHQRQTTSAGTQFKADKRAVDLEIPECRHRGCHRDRGSATSRNGRFQSKSPPYRCRRVLHHFTRLRLQQMDNGSLISGRGVKYWPAPDLVSLALFATALRTYRRSRRGLPVSPLYQSSASI